MKKKKHYPREMFVMGFCMTLLRTAVIPVLALILGIVNVVLIRPILPELPFVLLAVWLIYAVIDQLRVRHRVLNGDDPLFEARTDPEHADDWKELAKKDVQEKIRAHLAQGDADVDQDSENKNDVEE